MTAVFKAGSVTITLKEWGCSRLLRLTACWLVPGVLLLIAPAAAQSGGFSWLKHVGASIIVNPGSALSGASLGLVYKEEY